ncbi:MAG: transporter [Pseudomonadota bacterium]
MGLRACVLVFSLVACSATAQEPIVCTDRPTNGNAVCTVPEGRFQIEMDFINWSRSDTAFGDTETLLFTNPILKYGLTGRSDLQVSISPRVRTRTDTATGRISDSTVSDLLIRYKYRFSETGARVDYGVIPFITIPTASDGNDRVSGGVAVPISFALSDKWTLVTSPQINLVPDSASGGYHLGLVNLINLGYAVTSRFALYGEIFAQNDFDPAGESHVYTADFAATYLITPRIQIDAGANIGLSDEAADLQLYSGLSVLF